MGHDYTPPNSRPNTPDPETPKSARQHSNVEASIATPTSIASTSPALAPEISAFSVPKHLTQGFVEIDPQLKRFQQDLLVLTGLNDNSTLHWRPTWFTQESLSKNFWTIHNPPNVVTEKLLSTVPQGREYYTRRMRRDDGAPPPPYIKDWDHWRHYCDMYGIPHDFLCEEQVSFMRMGLPRNENGVLCPPPAHPLYPEPQPLRQGRYILNPSTYSTHLPRKFHSVNHDADVQEDLEAIIVHSSGALKVESRENMFMHESQITHFDGTGGYVLDAVHSYDERALKQQGPGRRWSYVPWTREQEESYGKKKLVVKLKVYTKVNPKRKWRCDEIEEKVSKKQKANRLLGELK